MRIFLPLVFCLSVFAAASMSVALPQDPEAVPEQKPLTNPGNPTTLPYNPPTNPFGTKPTDESPTTNTGSEGGRMAAPAPSANPQPSP